MNELVQVRLESQMAELLLRVKPELYRKQVMIIKGKEILYVILRKAL